MEIIEIAQRANRTDMKAAALERLKRIQDIVRKPNDAGAKMDRLTGLDICRGFTAGRDFQDGWEALNEMTENKWDGYALLGTELAERGDSRQARRALRLAWKQFHLNYRLTSSESASLPSEIGQALAKAGDLRGPVCG